MADCLDSISPENYIPSSQAGREHRLSCVLLPTADNLSRACHKALFIRLAESKGLSSANDRSARVISAEAVLRLLG